MGKIGRNQACPCGSGKKHKHCCLSAVKAATPSPRQAVQASLQPMIEKVQEAAAEKKAQFYEKGVFLFFTNTAGDAWMLEITDSDAVQIAKKGEALSSESIVQEDQNSISINFSHTFAIRKRALYLTSYEDQSELLLIDAPTMRISAAIRRLRKNYPQQLLDTLHLDADGKQQKND